jgi:LPS-assembly protein
MESHPAGSATPLWKLPTIAYNGAIPVYATGMSFNWNANYVNYWRENGIGADRVDIHPSISMPVPLSRYLESSAEVGVRNTYYQVQEYGDATWQSGASQNRLLPDAQFEVATTLMREFATASFGGAALEHQLRPFIRYNYIPNINQNDLPSLDIIDRIDEQSLITYGIDNFFNIIRAAKTSKEYATFRIFQSYSLLDKDKDHPFGAIGARLTWTPAAYARFKYESYYDVYANTFSSQSLTGAYTTTRGDIFSIDYSYYDTATIDFQNRFSSIERYKAADGNSIQQINATVNTHITDRWLASLAMEHSLSSGSTQTFSVGLIYQAPCWSVQVQSQYNQIETRYYLVFSLANIASGLGVQF